MRILLWTSGGPFSPFGYGIVVKNMVPELEKLGHEVHILPTLGNRFISTDYTTHRGTYRMISNPSGGMDPDHMLWVYNDIEADVVVWHADAWATYSVLTMCIDQVPMVLYSPIDHEPLIDREIELFRRAQSVAIPSKWGVARANEAGLTVHYVPHGVDLKQFQPIEQAAKRQLREENGWDPDAFIFLNVAQNHGTRKNLPNLLRAFSRLPEKTPDGRAVRMAMHCYPFRDHRNDTGIQLGMLAEKLGIYDRLYWPDPMDYMRGFHEADVSMLYQLADVFVFPSKTEGFGLPLLEAMASGLPVITTDYASMSELVTPECGWLVDVVDMDVEPALDYAFWAIPSTKALEARMRDALAAPDLHIRGERARARACQYGWDVAAQAMSNALPAPVVA